jgi:hypothetical protein
VHIDVQTTFGGNLTPLNDKLECLSLFCPVLELTLRVEHRKVSHSDLDKEY